MYRVGGFTALVALFMVSSGCGARSAQVANAGEPASAAASRTAENSEGGGAPAPPFATEDFIRRVAQARELADERPAALKFHDDAAFARAAQATAEKDGLLPSVVDTGAFQLAFGFALLARASSPPYAKTQREHLLAFYDRSSHVVHARRDPHLPNGDASLELLIAHEVGHALQAEHFPEPKFSTLTNEDERLARLALFEGDAMLTMLAFQAREGFVPLGRRLLVAAQNSGDVATFERASGMDQEAESMPALTRTRLEFPYESGLLFVSDLFRTGGFDLVNRAFDKVPVTTEQVLHPERYLAGDRPLSVRVPETPPGFTTVVEGTVGELLTRLALSACVKAPVAVTAAEGWGGDSFKVVEKDGLAGLLWATAWDTPKDARQFEVAVRELSKCWAEAQLHAKSIFAGPARIQRRGRHVAVIRGIPPSEARGLAAELLTLPGNRRPAEPPFGLMKLRERAKPPKLAGPRRVGQSVIAPQMGFRAAIPKGYTPEFSEIVILKQEPPSGARIVVSLSGLVITPESRESLNAEYAEAVESEIGALLSVERAEEQLTTPMGTGVMRTWIVGRGPLRFQLLVIPMCGNSGGLLVAFASADDRIEADQRRWLDTLEPLSDNDRGVCRALDP